MSGARPRRGGILAAGEGSRLRRDGFAMPKPLVPIGGVPLVGHVLGHFAAAGIASLTIIFNEEEEECAEWIRSRFRDLDLNIIIKTTASSLESFREIAPYLGPGRSLVSTVDAFCPRADFVAFVRAAERFPEERAVLAVTPFVDDEKPLWAHLEGDRITRLGGDRGDVVTAGMYLVPERLHGLAARPGLGRLRDYLGLLLERGEPVHAVSIPRVVDVDRAADVALAEAAALRPAADPRAARGGTA